MSRLAVGLALVIVGGGALAVAAPGGDAPGARHVLHEDLPAPAVDDDSPLVGQTPAAGQNPAAFTAGDKVLPEPAMGPAKDGEPVLGRSGFAADRDTETRPDYNTGADGTLHYVSVFNPDVLPFKRMSALDRVRDDYMLTIASATTVELPVGGHTDPSRDRFWGSVMVELQPGRDVALPSVAPDMRILSYEAEPRTTLTFSKDGADNFYVRSDESSAQGTYRVNFLVDADAGYFAPQIPAAVSGMRLRDIADAADDAGLAVPLPTNVAAEAQRSLRILGLSSASYFGDALNKLVYYFRGFEAKQLGDLTGDVYRDLFDNQAGVCRHRSFAFLITAAAAGIPTRYVTNEAHAFVEVWVPRRGWQRVDLGGAALRLEVTGADGKTLHRPRAEDPFAKPPEYTQNYTQLQGDVRGLSASQLADKRKPLGDDASGDYGPLVDGSDDGGDGSGDVDDTGDAVAPGDDGNHRPPDPKKLSPSVTVTMVDSVGYRGEPIHVEGRVDDPHGAMANVRVDVFVAPPGQGGNRAVLIGRGATDATGRFALDADVPADLQLWTYELYVSTPETATHNAAISD
ncbi:MAG: transglutaminase domain-containing protein [Kofleriaceae bacterium]|nr:transglutaminase domain-containing protein [Myxococcales bacterium]MCB9562300.1 transglutaminase domain-containing protein [Kofleriaceae bacterium]MCB9572092.1 transglutaminase domain-containing protein [Kofleriaceae bacterium]